MLQRGNTHSYFSRSTIPNGLCNNVIRLLIQLCGLQAPHNPVHEQPGKDSPFAPPHSGAFHSYSLAHTYHIRKSSSGLSLTGLPGIGPTGERGLRWELFKVGVCYQAHGYAKVRSFTGSDSPRC